MKGCMILVIVVGACGPSERRGGGAGPDGSGGDPGGDGAGSSADGCSDDAKLVYVVDVNKKLSKFHPPTKAFTDIGTLNCPATGSFEIPFPTPFSMGIDRDATAWVLYNSGELFRVDTKTLACTKSAWRRNRSGHELFGMGFSTDAAGGTADTLFIGAGGGPGNDPTSTLASVNMTTFEPTDYGDMDGWPELTGTGNAELWGFFPGDNTRVVQINKQNGSVMKTYPAAALNGSISNGSWAFAFYGGDFWIFLRKSGEGSTTVHQMNGMTGALTGSTVANGRNIVGAGVSTCAPVIIF